MKTVFIFLAVLFSLNLHSQKEVKIIFNDGTEKIGDYKIKVPLMSRIPIVESKKTKEKYKLEVIKSVTVYDGLAVLNYEVIDAKNNIDDTKSEKLLGLLVYSGTTVELFNVEEAVHSSTIAPYTETYARRKSESIAFNIGYIYGIDARSAKKRLKNYFSDCPQLIAKIDSNEIDKEKSLEIAQFYEKNCSKN